MSEIGLDAPTIVSRESADGADTASLRVPGRGRVDRSRPLRLSFDGRPIEAFAGDTVASALLAGGVHLVGRSFKYHRPRGILTAGSEEPNALLEVSRHGGRFEPNTRATMQEVFDGLTVESQNRWPSLAFDVGAVNDRLSPLLPAGFYYKTFKWPPGFWSAVYEPLIRRAAGLGHAPRTLDPDRYSARYHHCDVLVVGAGPAGIAAALAAGAAGARVTLADEGSEPGGWLLSAPGAEIDGAPAAAFLNEALQRLRAMETVRILARTTVTGLDHQNMAIAAERVADHHAVPPEGAPRERLWRIRAREIVLAQGALERPLVFEGNDRPGVMLAGAAQTYLNRYGVAIGRKVALAGAHDSLLHTAIELIGAGIEIAAVADARTAPPEGLLAAARAKGLRVLAGARPVATSGRRRVRAVTLAGGEAGTGAVIACDTLLMGGGWTPSVHLFSHTRGSLRFTGDAFVPGDSRERVRCAGAGAGRWGIGSALKDGSHAGAAAAEAAGFTASSRTYRVEGDDAGEGVAAPIEGGRKAFVDFQNDVTRKDIRLAVREGMHSVEHVKRYTTNGMATDQGKTSNINALFVAAEALGASPPDVGLTTFRPPFTPVSFGTVAGTRRGVGFEAERRTPIDPWAEAQGAVFEPVAQWRRARYFPRPGETMDAAVARECRAVRNSLGLFDASTLGKIELVGPDAAQFLNRFYTNPLLKLAPGRCRYVVLLGEDGFIRDDGIVGCLAPDRYHITTTTGGAARVLAMMEDYLQTEWPELDVFATSITEHFATIGLNGPNARRALLPLVEGLDVRADAFPHMSVGTCRVASIPARLFRVSFTGELGYEINVPARHALELWSALLEAGALHAVTPYGTEAMHVLRAEKGYIIVGQDTDGTLTPKDAGLGWAVGKTKADFVGKRSLARPDMVAPGRRELVGLLSEDPQVVLEEGGQIVLDPAQPLPMRMIGHVTSAYHSAALGRSIALAVVEDGRARIGETLHVPLEDAIHAATVVAPVFYDEKGERLHV